MSVPVVKIIDKAARTTGWIDPREIVACYRTADDRGVVVLLRSNSNAQITIESTTPEKILEAVDAAYRAAGL